MPWRIVRLCVELTSAIAVLRLFRGCQTFAEGWQRLLGIDEAQQIGLIVATVIVVIALHEMSRALAQVLRLAALRKHLAARWHPRGCRSSHQPKKTCQRTRGGKDVMLR